MIHCCRKKCLYCYQIEESFTIVHTCMQPWFEFTLKNIMNWRANTAQWNMKRTRNPSRSDDISRRKMTLCPMTGMIWRKCIRFHIDVNVMNIRKMSTIICNCPLVWMNGRIAISSITSIPHIREHPLSAIRAPVTIIFLCPFKITYYFNI